ncbi:MAG TPA: replication-relaxation family protein, partial [Solirubrobacteraceae bacterium]
SPGLSPRAASLASVDATDDARVTSPAASSRKPTEATARTPTESYRELVDLNAAHSVRWAKSASTPTALDPEPLDIEILALIATMRHLLSSQIHRRFNDGRAATTTQRRLKRLSDAGLVARFQFHRRDGGGVPMCYSVTPAGLSLCREHSGTVLDDGGGRVDRKNDPLIPSHPPVGDHLLRQARHDVRAAGWALAAERALAGGPLALRGPEESAIMPPSRVKAGERLLLAPRDLCLPGGRTPHDFLRTVDSGSRVEVERFQTIRPDASLRTKDGRELLVELDDRLPEGAGAAKIERYDHFLAGWCAHIERYAQPGAELPFVVFVCRDSSRARECARRADRVLSACRAYAGEYPFSWQYPGRERVVFASERDAHEGRLCACGIPRLPPEVRADAAGGDPRAREPRLEVCDIWPG